MSHKTHILWIFLQCAAALFSPALGENGVLKGEDSGLDELSTDNKPIDGLIKYNLRKSLDLEQEGCYLQAGKKDGLVECGFNATAKTIFIIHGWTMSGMFESWMHKLVSAVMQREKEANVVIVDWIAMAQQLYPDAVNHTHTVGLHIAAMLNWLQDEEQLPLQNVHLIGYSLGAHVAGYAGTYVRGTIGRITGLDPAGPMFEGAEEQKRLSPDDADFVDVLHTYTREALGVSIGIQQPIGDIDIYPNGGDVQPGCALGDVLAVAGNFMEVMKCEHERAVHLFVDSLMNKDHMSFAYQCTGPDRFKKGICLSCRKNRCNNIGYNARKMRKRRNSKMYLKTRADTPFGGYHYQMKMHVFNRKQSDNADPTFHVKLYGAQNDTSNIFVDVHDDAVGLNLTNTFLVFTEKEIGDLLKIRLSWEGESESLHSVWKNIKKSFWAWNTKPPKPVLEVRRIRVKAGETQKKFTFCAQDPSKTEISPGESISFVKCRDHTVPCRTQRTTDTNMSRVHWAEDDFDPPSGTYRLGTSQPVSDRTYVMYHGTTRDCCRGIQASGFQQSSGGMLGPGVYLSRDLEKASRYPIKHPEYDRVVIKVLAKVGNVIAINRQNHPLQKTWHMHGYDSAWVPPNCGMVRSGLEENCIWDPQRISILKVIKPISTDEDDDDSDDDSKESTSSGCVIM